MNKRLIVAALFRKHVDHINVFKNLLRKYEAATIDKKDIHSQELMKTLDLITDPKTKLEVSIKYIFEIFEFFFM